MSTMDSLLRALDAPTKAEQRAAAQALGMAGRRDAALVERLRAELGRGTPLRRWLVAYALFLTGDRSERLWPALATALGSDDGDLRWAAARLLVALEVPDLSARLVAAVGTGAAAARKMALYCLRERRERGTRIEHAIVVALGDGDRGVRLAAMAAAVAAVEPVRAAAAVAARLDDGDAGVRRAAAATLGQIGVAAPAVVAALERAARGSDEALARAARGALERMAGTGRP
jgi:HEAT repeat protein